MQLSTDALRRPLAGTDVLGVFAALLLASGLLGYSVPVDVATILMTAGRQNLAMLSAVPSDLLLVAGVYLQAVGLAALYRIGSDVYGALGEPTDTRKTDGTGGQYGAD